MTATSTPRSKPAPAGRGACAHRSASNMRVSAIVLLSIVLSSCSQTIKRQAHFLPLMDETFWDGMVLYSGKVRFIQQKDEVSYTTPEMKNPPKATVSRQSDGSVVVTWISTTKRPEKLMYIDSGVHPDGFPNESIMESFDLNADIPLGEPVVLSNFGPNTAFLRDIVDLRPIPDPNKGRQATASPSPAP